MLTARQQYILSTVIQGHVELGRPVGSRWLSDQPGIDWSPSTIRYELATLEEMGYLDHPHTSAGRVPTDFGYRFYVDTLLQHGGLPAPRPDTSFELELTSMRREVDTAMRFTTETLSRVTDLVAAVSAPPLHTTTIKHVEILLLQPHVVLVVVISSSGGVTKRAFTFGQPIDPGLVDWAASYLNERIEGMSLGALSLRGKLDEPGLTEVEHDFLETIAPALADLEETSEPTIYVEGATRLLEGGRFADMTAVNDLMRMLERRVSLLSVLRSALTQQTIYLRIGRENEEPELRAASVIAANYGLGHRTLGAVSVIGPVRMDYPQAIESVQLAARALSHFVEEVYE